MRGLDRFELLFPVYAVVDSTSQKGVKQTCWPASDNLWLRIGQDYNTLCPVLEPHNGGSF
jgi:hypothetical protein